jgi:hypothetical protein
MKPLIARRGTGHGSAHAPSRGRAGRSRAPGVRRRTDPSRRPAPDRTGRSAARGEGPLSPGHLHAAAALDAGEQRCPDAPYLPLPPYAARSALQRLERGRTVLPSQMLDTRGDISDPRWSRPGLPDRPRRANLGGVTEVRAATTSSSASSWSASVYARPTTPPCPSWSPSSATIPNTDGSSPTAAGWRCPATRHR